MWAGLTGLEKEISKFLAGTYFGRTIWKSASEVVVRLWQKVKKMMLSYNIFGGYRLLKGKCLISSYLFLGAF
ncbi:hypothetical protein BSG1_20049 [Bacillus sp. SG-1]|nr:hypothetical protein BSG1_20049 [Bacillus sp. SG-1]